MMTTTKPVRATELRMFVPERGAGDVLADGSHVLKVSIQVDKVYVKLLTTAGHFRTRRYAHDKMVEVQA